MCVCVCACVPVCVCECVAVSALLDGIRTLGEQLNDVRSKLAQHNQFQKRVDVLEALLLRTFPREFQELDHYIAAVVASVFLAVLATLV